MKFKRFLSGVIAVATLASVIVQPVAFSASELEQAESNGIELYAMDAGEIVTFMASAGNARRSQQVSVTRGTMYRYADYGYGSYLTYQYTVKFGNISATAYCVQPSKPGLGSGTYTINKVGDGKALAKVCYYGTKASGDDGFFTEENGYGNLSAGARFMVHIVASYVGSEVCYGAVVQLVLRLLYIIYSRAWEHCRQAPMR